MCVHVFIVHMRVCMQTLPVHVYVRLAAGANRPRWTVGATPATQCVASSQGAPSPVSRIVKTRRGEVAFQNG